MKKYLFSSQEKANWRTTVAIYAGVE